MAIELTNNQERAIVSISKWYQDYKSGASNKQLFRLFGYAGTGKTFLAAHLAKTLGISVRYAAFTGKAALMMVKKGCEGASTIHSMIYHCGEDEFGNITVKLNKWSDLRDHDLLIIDECSMVDERLGLDLLSFQKPILVIGDPAQLPPISGAGYFTNYKEDWMLTEIHRQARESGIIRLATKIRLGGHVERSDQAKDVVFHDGVNQLNYKDYSQIIVGKNLTRTRWNDQIRAKFYGFDPKHPVQGDKIICIKNNHQKGILNGEFFTVGKHIQVETDYIVNFQAKSEMRDGYAPFKTHLSYFRDDVSDEGVNKKLIDHFNYGYAITCHKAQGSQWEHPFIKMEAFGTNENQRSWNYTAITRASERVTLMI